MLLQALPDRFHPRLRKDCLRRKADQWAFVTPASYDFNNFACSAAKANPVRRSFLTNCAVRPHDAGTNYNHRREQSHCVQAKGNFVRALGVLQGEAPEHFM